MIDMTRLPRHIAIIMDGNGRWAKQRGLPRVMGHRAGIKSVRSVVRRCRELGVEVLTLYAFSAENWQRPQEEVDTLMRFLEVFLQKEAQELKRNHIRLNAIGRIDKLPTAVRKKLRQVMALTRENAGLVLNLALNYSGRLEILDAARRLAQRACRHPEELQQLDEQQFASYLYTKGLPDPDLLIRTSGEMRLSNFLLWQVSYSEFYCTPKLWPDFHEKDLEAAIEEYQRRERRFGTAGPLSSKGRGAGPSTECIPSDAEGLGAGP